MTLIETAPDWLFIAYAVILFIAAAQDLMARKISNLLPLALIIGAIVAVVLEGFSAELWQNAALFVAVLVLGTFSFGRGWVGGGDVKLLAAVALWFGLMSGLRMVVVTFLVGGLVTIVMLMVRMAFRGKSKKSRLIPYGVAIAIGAVGTGLWYRI
ncbi:A24 family peptidase [Sphingomicrobium sediminis]|uniref:Prepilin peptidase n=1 Tax=Sphingomicrobium sediminis TaxID=2950949 RepID=A0A9X2EM74_9SPHN|nr:prepilin peptidase [Sphingomicrobium sediminis]MCM8557954.1 prepilin peptidase [Sphingomicrobium sediminis]